MSQVKPPSEKQLSHDVERRLTTLLLVVSLAGIAYLFLQISMFGYGRDQGIYATVAESMLRGGVPYRDSWDFKPPGIFAVYALARSVFGRAEWGIRLFEIAGLASMTAAFVILAKRFFHDWRVGIVGAALGVLVHAELEFWHTGQPESFGGILTAWALVVATFEPDANDPKRKAKQRGAWALAGVLYGMTFLLKPPLGGGVVASAAFVTLRLYRTSFAARRNEDAPTHPGAKQPASSPAPIHPGATTMRSVVEPAARADVSTQPSAESLFDLAWPTLAMALGSIATVAICIGWFALRGGLRDLYEVLFVFTPHYTKLSWEGATVTGAIYLALEEWFVDLSSPTAAGVLSALILLPKASREREGVLHLLAVIGVQLVGVAMQGKYFPYHYGASLLLGSLIAGLGAFKLWELALARGLPGVAVFATAVPIVIFARSATRNTQTDFLDRCVDRHRQLLGLSDKTRAELDARLYSVADVSYGANRQVADYLRRELAPTDLAYIFGFEPVIYDMSERRPASRYIYNVPQRVAWAKDRARAELIADLDAHPPKAIVVEHRDVFPVVTGDAIDSADTLKKFPELFARIHDRYELATTIEDFDVYLAR